MLSQRNTTSIGPSYASKSLSLVCTRSQPACSREAAIERVRHGKPHSVCNARGPREHVDRIDACLREGNPSTIHDCPGEFRIESSHEPVPSQLEEHN